MPNVMIVEDCPLTLRLLEKYLQRIPGIDLTLTSDGEEAAKLWNRNRPDLSIVGIQMERMDGLQLLRHILDTDPIADVILVSADETRAEASRMLGARAFISKFELHRLAPLTRDLLFPIDLSLDEFVSSSANSVLERP